MKKAWVENGIIRDICDSDPAETYHPDIAQHYCVSVPEYCVNGARLLEGSWVNPIIEVPAEPETPKVLILTPTQFKLCFTVQERVLINRAKKLDEVVQVAFEILDDQKLEEVHLDKKCTTDTVDYLVAIGCITHDRGIDVKAGKQI